MQDVDAFFCNPHICGEYANLIRICESFYLKTHICDRPNYPIFVETLVVMCVTHRKSECVESLETQVGRTHFLLATQGHQMFTCIHTKIHKNYNIHTIHTNGYITALQLEITIYLLFIGISRENRKFSGNFSYRDLSRLF